MSAFSLRSRSPRANQDHDPTAKGPAEKLHGFHSCFLGYLSFVTICGVFGAILLHLFGSSAAQHREDNVHCPPHPDSGADAKMRSGCSFQYFSEEVPLMSKGGAPLGLAMVGVSCFGTRRFSTYTELLLTPLLTNRSGANGKAICRSFTCFARSDSFSMFLRGVLSQVEQHLYLKDYHMRIVPRRKHWPLGPKWSKLLISVQWNETFRKRAEYAGFVILIVGSSIIECNKFVPMSPALQELDVPIAYTDGAGKKIQADVTGQDLLVREGAAARCFLDAQGRTMYVVTLRRFARRQTELDDTELQDLWLCGLDAIASLHNVGTPGRLGTQLDSDGFADIRINAGKYQNMAHVHLKLWMDNVTFLHRWGNTTVYKKLTSFAS